MSDHYSNGRFFNPGGANGQPFWKVPRMLTERGAAWPAHVDVVPRQPPAPAVSGTVVSFIGHATFLLQTAAGTLITDPVFSRRAGPFSLLGPPRVSAPGVRLQDLPHIDVVLLSHNHYDHCDLAALRAIAQRHRPRVVTPLGNARVIKSAGFADVAELDWWEAWRGTVRDAMLPLTITATPAQHFSARTPWDRNRALWAGFVIDAGRQRLYFAGDSGYASLFGEIGRRFAPIDLAMIPIGAYDPRWFMKDIHMNPEEAVQAHLDVGARQSLGMHFGTFRLTTEPIDEPERRLQVARAAAGLGETAFTTLRSGGSLLLT